MLIDITRQAQTTRFYPFGNAALAPDKIVTLPPIKMRASMGADYYICLGEQTCYTPRHMLNLLEQPKESASIHYGADRSLTFVNTISELYIDGKTITLILQPYVLELPTDVVNGLEEYFEFSVDLHDHLRTRQQNGLQA
jgi:hypothetical protein